MKHKYLLTYLIPTMILQLTSYGVGPTEISPWAWYKADEGVKVDGTKVLTWHDQSGFNAFYSAS